MVRSFEAATFSMSGTSHRKRGAESQDAAVLDKQDSYLLMGVSDGVSSCEESRVGAVMLSQSLRKLVARYHVALVAKAAELPPATFCICLSAWLNTNLGAELRRAREYLGPGRKSDHALSATLLGAFASEHGVAGFGCSDGIFAVNGKVRVLECVSKNVPNLPIYGVLDPSEPGVSQNSGKIRPIFAAPLADISSVLIGTDGVEELMPFLRPKMLGAHSRSSWTEDLFCRSLGLSANGLLPYDDATAVAMWRSFGNDAPVFPT